SGISRGPLVTGSGWLLHRAAAPHDVTPLFLELYASARRGQGRLRRLARRDAMVIVPGLFTERYPFYLRRAARRLRQPGLAVGAVVGGLFRGSPRAFWELRYDERREFLDAHPLPPVRALSLVTTTARAGPILERTRRLIAERHGAPSDGFVPPIDAYIPGSR